MIYSAPKATVDVYSTTAIRGADVLSVGVDDPQAGVGPDGGLVLRLPSRVADSTTSVEVRLAPEVTIGLSRTLNGVLDERASTSLAQPEAAGCSCGMADFGAPGHDGDPLAELPDHLRWEAYVADAFGWVIPDDELEERFACLPETWGDLPDDYEPPFDRVVVARGRALPKPKGLSLARREPNPRPVDDFLTWELDEDDTRARARAMWTAARGAAEALNREALERWVAAGRGVGDNGEEAQHPDEDPGGP